MTDKQLYAHRWLSRMWDCDQEISEGVPIKNTKVLATFVNGVVGTAYYSDDSYVGDVVAWMPLPEPYKEGGADMCKPNCVTCDHFGDCDGCEKGGEE